MNRADLSTAETLTPLIEGEVTPARYAELLLQSLGINPVQFDLSDNRSAAELWLDSGAMWLSGHADGVARFCEVPLAACAQGAWLALASISSQSAGTLNAHRLLGERAAIAGLNRNGRISAGGACRLLTTADGFIALNLAREDDRDLLPAWLEQERIDNSQLPELLKLQPTNILIERGRLLGLAVAPLTAVRLNSETAVSWFKTTGFAPATDNNKSAPVVVDLSSLWAGPLCGQLLAQCGARVIKVESISRPDGARNGPAAFYDLMNANKESVALDLTSKIGQQQLKALLARADMVIESSRPRALENMGISAAELLSDNPGKVWLSLTGYGREMPMRDWIAYGDDAGVAAGLSWLMGGQVGDPVFCGDAIADPLTGLHAALLAWSCWQAGGGQLLDVSLYHIVAHCISMGKSLSTGLSPEDGREPVSRKVMQAAPELGVDTESVLREFL